MLALLISPSSRITMSKSAQKRPADSRDCDYRGAKNRKVSDAQLLVDNIRGEKSKYTEQDHEDVARAWEEANAAVQELESPFVHSGVREARQQQWEDRRQAIIAHIGGGTGTIFLMRRGDFGVTNYVLKAKNKSGHPRFIYHQGTKHIMPQDQWPNSHKFWIYKFKAPHPVVVEKIQAHSELSGWTVTDLGRKPMDFVATDRQIYDHIQRQKEKIDLDSFPVEQFFSGERGIKSLRSWMDAQEAIFEGGSSSTALWTEW